MIINNGVISFNATYIPINKIHKVERIEYFNNKLTNVSSPATVIDSASAVFVTSLDFTIAIPNHINIGKNVKAQEINKRVSFFFLRLAVV